MALVKRFQDLRCWQKSRMLVNEVYQLSNQGKIRRDFGLRDQLRRAAVSTMTNIAEGFGRFSSRDTIRFLDISQSSASEVISLLYIVKDQSYASEKTVDDIQALAIEVRKLTLGLARHLHQNNRKGK